MYSCTGLGDLMAFPTLAIHIPKTTRSADDQTRAPSDVPRHKSRLLCKAVSCEAPIGRIALPRVIAQLFHKAGVVKPTQTQTWVCLSGGRSCRSYDTAARSGVRHAEL